MPYKGLVTEGGIQGPHGGLSYRRIGDEGSEVSLITQEVPGGRILVDNLTTVTVREHGLFILQFR